MLMDVQKRQARVSYAAARGRSYSIQARTGEGWRAARYRPAVGVLVVSRALPAPYRILGLLAGVGWAGAVAVGTRTHRDAEAAIAAIRARAGV